jgi:adenosylmethionine-8-amino-7-oxononanoate aminotransferase
MGNRGRIRKTEERSVRQAIELAADRGIYVRLIASSFKRDRTGGPTARGGPPDCGGCDRADGARSGRMFASQHESVIPDIMILVKMLIQWYLQFVITLLIEQIFSTYGASSEEERTLYYGHSYTGNALTCAGANASLEIFEKENVLEALVGKIHALGSELAPLRELPWVADVRQRGFIAGVEVRVDHLQTGAANAQLGAAVCVAARRHGLLTRPIRNVIVLMPPFCITLSQLRQAVQAVSAAIVEVCADKVPA